METTWSLMPSETLVPAFISCSRDFIAQEVSNAIYGLAVMDAAWDSLPIEMCIAIKDAIMDTISGMTVQVRQLSLLSLINIQSVTWNRLKLCCFTIAIC